MLGRPIRPEEVVEQKKDTIPSEVFDAFNELILENYRRGYATIKQKDVVRRMTKKGISSSEAFDKGWLDVERIYSENGWDVTYDKPGYNESYEPSFSFKRRQEPITQRY